MSPVFAVVFLPAAALALGISAGVSWSADAQPAPKTAKVVVGAGCFWCLEAILEAQPGVVSAVSGYAGGAKKEPTYKQVGTGGTGHAECVEVEYDPAKTTIAKLLEPFWKSFDPTVPNGVAPDFGTQYRAVLLYANDDQKQAIEASLAEVQKRYNKPLEVEVSKLDVFYPAEDYPQDYVKKNPEDGYVRGVSIPRMREAGVAPPER